MHNSMTGDLKKISEWFKNNLLVLNADKTKILFYNSKCRELKNMQDC